MNICGVPSTTPSTRVLSVFVCLYLRRKRNGLEGGSYGGRALYPACCMGRGTTSFPEKAPGKVDSQGESRENRRWRGSVGLVTLSLAVGVRDGGARR